MKRRVTKQDLRRPWMLLLIGLTILLIAWLIWSALFAQPTKRDYEQALARTTTLVQSQNRLQSASASHVQAIVASLRLTLDGSNVQDDTAATKQTLQDELASYRAAADSLKATRAGRDADVKEPLNDVNQHTDSLHGSIQSIVNDYDELYRAYVACDPVVRYETTDAADAPNYDSVSGPCLKTLDVLSKASTRKLADYAKQAKELIDEKRQLYADGAALSELQAVDARFGTLDPLSRVQQLSQELFTTSDYDLLKSVLERKRDRS